MPRAFGVVAVLLTLLPDERRAALRRTEAFAFALACAAGLAGCVTDPLSSASLAPVGPAAALDALRSALVLDHDHTDAALHPHAEQGLRQVFETNLPLDGAALSPASEFQLHGQYAYVSLFHPSAGIVILDLADPAKPAQVGRFDSGTAYVNDVEVSPDGRWAFLPTSPLETRENDPADGGTPVVGDHGIQVVDVSDPTAPTLAAVWVSPDPDPLRIPIPPRPSPNDGPRQALGMGYHRLDLEEVDGALYVAAASLGFPRVDVLRFDPAPVPRLSLVSTYVSDDALDLGKDRGSYSGGYGVHDVTFDPDPLDGFPLIAVSHWRSGAHFLDASDPSAPRYLGRWNEFPDEGGNVHNVEFTAIEGRRVAVAVPEYPAGSPTQGYIALVDVTDFAAPETIGVWRLPAVLATDDPAATGEHVYSTNRVLLREGLLFDAHFHAGVVVLDVSTLAKAAAPELVGWVLPRGEARVPYFGIEATPYVYDAIPRGHYLYYTDLTGGFHAAQMPEALLAGRAFAAPGT